MVGNGTVLHLNFTVDRPAAEKSVPHAIADLPPGNAVLPVNAPAEVIPDQLGVAHASYHFFSIFTESAIAGSLLTSSDPSRMPLTRLLPATGLAVPLLPSAPKTLILSASWSSMVDWIAVVAHPEASVPLSVASGLMPSFFSVVHAWVKPS